MKWLFLNARSSFEQYRKDWDALNRSQDNHILLDSRFVAPLIKHFGSKDTVLAISREGPKRGLALLQKTGMGFWSTFQPSQSPLGLVLFGHKDEGHEGLFELMRDLPGYTLSLSVLQQDPLYSSFSAVSTRDNVETIPYIDTPRLQLSGTFEEYWQQRSKNLRHNLDRQNRRIQEQSRSLQLVSEIDPPHMEACIREYGRMESAGWKAEGGTAIDANNDQGRFYKEILEDFASTGESVVFQLILDGKVVATDLCLRRNGMLVVLKTTYDEKVDKLSPALLMRREIVRQIYTDNEIQVVEFYGRLRDWHTQWMTDVRTMFHLNIFRNLYMVRSRRILKRFR